MKQFLAKDETNCEYYMVNEGMGGFLNPPGEAEHNYRILMVERGREAGSMSLGGALKEKWTPEPVKSAARTMLAAHPGTITEEWIVEVYRYFKHFYSKDWTNRNVSDAVYYGKFWGNAEQEQTENPEHHLGYLFVKKFDPNHTPRLDLIFPNA